MTDKTFFIKKINKLKEEKNAVILAHCYQNIEVDKVADFVGDSLYLSQQAAYTRAEIIVFAGVYFMAETAKILSPNKKVLLPRLESGCMMADMINLEQMREFKAKNPDIPVVCYVNSTAEVKSESDICCTSSNAVAVIKSLGVPKVLFVPDTYLGKFAQSQLDGVEVITYPGFCPTHLRILTNDIKTMREKYPEAMVLAHPECHQEVAKMADFVGSTTQIMNEVKKSSPDEFIIATEKGVVDRLERDLPDKKFYLVTPKALCHNMKWHYLEDIYNALLNEEHEIFVDKDVAAKAYAPIEKMVNLKLK
ncbi:MAG: quinolinate synthase NadA [Candidatus Gastranaerophilales bacterium]|nr:quinolinate synthase NadA [Candidatus Gastranaerophilales bacterium]